MASLTLVTVLGVAFVALKSLSAYHEHSRPVPDELAYLELANELAEAGGWRTFLQRCWTGDYREANRHPLYLLLLSAIAQRDPAFYAHAKLASWTIGLLTTAVILGLVARTSGPAASVCVAFLLGHNDLWVTHMSAVHVEMLLFALLLVAWSVMWFAPASVRWHVLAGVALGLAYLAKATAVIVWIAYGLALLVTRRVQAFRCRVAGCTLLAGLVVASPLLLRNVRVYGNPLYNVNSKYMWLDDWSQVRLIEESDLSEFSLGSFVRRHGVAALGTRVLHGLARESIFLCTALYPLNVRVSVETVAGGALLLVVAILGIGRLPGATIRVMTRLMVVGFLAALALHTPHGSHPRFQLTLVPVLYVTFALQLSASAARVVARVSDGRPRLNRVAGLVAATGACTLACISLTKGDEWSRTWPPRLLAVTQPSASELELAAWLESHLTDGDTLALAEGTPFSPFWYRKIPGRMVVCPAGLDSAAFESWSGRRRVTYAVLSLSQLPKWAVHWPGMSPSDPPESSANDGWKLEICVEPLCIYRHSSPD